MNINLGGLLGGILGGVIGAGLAYMLFPFTPDRAEAVGKLYGMFCFGGLLIGGVGANVLWEELKKRK